MRKDNIPTLRFLFFTMTLVLSSVTSALSFVHESYRYVIFSILILIISIYQIIFEYNNSIRKILFMFNAIKCNDYTFHFSERTKNINTRTLNASLNRIKNIIMSARDKAREREKYYELIMNCVQTGVITIDDKGNVYQVNNEAMRLFGLIVFTHLNQLRSIDSSLPKKLNDIRPQERSLTSFSNERGQVSLALHASEIILDNKKLRIISINDINNDLNEKEIESWVKLIRVLTHEIMNSLAPITSLSQTLLDINIEKDTDKDSDITKGLETINYTSKSLVEFVDSYRKFTRIQPPIKRPFKVKPMLEGITNLICTHDIKLSLNIHPEDIMIYADENLIIQVVLNVIKNGIQAIELNTDKQITIESEIKANQGIEIKITNNGNAIPKDIVDNIFMPFFTTKESGSGVGLSISRQIMHLHGGEITLASNREGNVAFLIIFP